MSEGDSTLVACIFGCQFSFFSLLFPSFPAHVLYIDLTLSAGYSSPTPHVFLVYRIEYFGYYNLSAFSAKPLSGLRAGTTSDLFLHPQQLSQQHSFVIK